MLIWQEAKNYLKIVNVPKHISSITLELITIAGKKVYQKNIQITGKEIPKPNLPDGTYIYRIKHNNKVLKTGKIILWS